MSASYIFIQFPFLQEGPMFQSLCKRQTLTSTLSHPAIPHFSHQYKLRVVKIDLSNPYFTLHYSHQNILILSLILYAWCPGNLPSTVGTVCIPEGFPPILCMHVILFFPGLWEMVSVPNVVFSYISVSVESVKLSELGVVVSDSR